MSISNKIKALLLAKDKTNNDCISALNLSNINVLNTKYSRKSFKAQELITLANLTNTKLAFIDEDNNPVIIFDQSDNL